MEVTITVKRLDLIEQLWTEVSNTVQEVLIKTILRKQKSKKEKWLYDEALQVAEIRREVKGKEKREDIPI